MSTDHYDDLLSSIAGSISGSGQPQSHGDSGSSSYPSQSEAMSSGLRSHSPTHGHAGAMGATATHSITIASPHSAGSHREYGDAEQQQQQQQHSPSPSHSQSHSRPAGSQMSGNVSAEAHRSPSPFAAALAASSGSVSGAAPPHAGPLPAASAGIRSFVEMGTEENDVEFVQQQIDYHWSRCKEEVMGRLVARQRRMEDEQRRLDSFRASYVTHVNALQEEIEKLKEANLLGEREAARHRGQHEQMVDRWSDKYRQVVAMRLMGAAWGRMRQHFFEQQELRRTEAKLAVPHYKRRMLSQFLSSWRSVARASKRAADERYWRDQVQQTTSNLIADYEKNLSELRHQLAQAEDVIRYHHEDQVAAEEKLRQAFIRGVCALNREAVSVFTTPAEVAEANIRSHFSASSVGQGAFMNAPSTGGPRDGAGNLPVPSPGGSNQPPPPTNPSAFSTGLGGPGSSGGGQPSAPLPSSFVGAGGPSAVSLSSSVPRNANQQPMAQQQQGSSRGPALSASVGRAPGHQLPYPAHSHAPPARIVPHPHPHQHPHPQVHPHPRPHPQPHTHSHPHPHPHPLPRTGGVPLHAVPQPRQGAPRPYGAR